MHGQTKQLKKKEILPAPTPHIMPNTNIVAKISLLKNCWPSEISQKKDSG